jgi:7-carboxy-7-deazaguanine synthase
MRISEIFYSIQGEGKLTGVPSAFIRTSGCNLRCIWCDSPYTSWHPQGESLSNAEILRRLATYPTRHVVLTGGEPLIAADVEGLTHAVKNAGYHLTLETAATVWKDVVCDLASISPKLSNSTPWDRDRKRAERHERDRINRDTIRRFMAFDDYQLKFVIDSPEDMAEVDELLEHLGDVDPAHVLLMPQGVTAEELFDRGRWLAELCKERHFRFCPRLQIELYGNVRGK